MTDTLLTEISKIEWGKTEATTDGRLHRFKDCKAWPGGAGNWDWRMTGTRHQPGIQPADIFEIVAKGVDLLILSRGMELAWQTCPETIQFLNDRRIEFHLEETSFAAELFNMLSKSGRRVGGIFHSTC